MKEGLILLTHMLVIHYLLFVCSKFLRKTRIQQKGEDQPV